MSGGAFRSRSCLARRGPPYGNRSEPRHRIQWIPEAWSDHWPSRIGRRGQQQMAMPACKTALVTVSAHAGAEGRHASCRARSTFDFEDVPVIIKAFRRMVRGLEFDISEMAITTYLTAKAHGKPFTAIPVFPMRAFHHGAILYNTRSGIRTPKDLEGKKVGVNRGYTVTTGPVGAKHPAARVRRGLEEDHLGAVRRRACRRIPAAVQRRADRGRAHARGDAALGGDRRRQSASRPTRRTSSR